MLSAEPARVQVEHHSWPLRPELLESAFMLWSLTGDARYMRLGEGTLEQLQQQARCRCGYCEVADIRNGAPRRLS